MATIKDVANKANVSIATVSRVMNNSFNVTSEKRKRVLDAVESIGYKHIPKHKEANLCTPRYILLITSIFLPELCSPLREAAAGAGFTLLILPMGEGDDGYEGIQPMIHALPEGLLAGIVLLNILYKEPILRDSLLRSYPIVQVGEVIPSKESYSVTTDDYKAAYEMTEYLISRGYRQIGLAYTQPLNAEMLFTKDRMRGYKNALRDHGISLEPTLMVEADLSYEGGVEVAEHFAQMVHRPEVVFCMTDTMAIGCIKGFEKAGLTIPRHIGVVGFDGITSSTYCSPSLTTIQQSYPEMAKGAIQMLQLLIQGDVTKGRQVFIEHELIIRESTK